MNEQNRAVPSASSVDFGHSAAQPGVEVVWAQGRVDASTCPEFETALRGAATTGAPWLVVDLSRVPYISSSGLKALVTAWRGCRARQGGLSIAGLNARLQEIFNMVGFTQLFPIYGTVAEAVAAAGESRS